MMNRTIGLALLALAACKGNGKSNDYAAMAKAANAARADAGNPLAMPAPPNATLLAFGQNSPRLLTVEGDSVFWLNEGGRIGPVGLFKAPKDGGKVTTLMEEPELTAMAVDGSDVYFLAPRAGKLGKVSRNGGAPVILTELQGLIRGMAIDDTDVFFAEDEGIHRVPKGGGKEQTVVQTGIPDYLVADNNAVYWYSNISGVVQKAPKHGGGASKVHADDQHTLHTIFVDGNDLFISYGAEKAMTIQRLGKSGGKPTPVVEGQDVASGFAIDGQNIYWSTDDTIFKAPRTGGQATKVVEKAEHAHDIAVDSQYVYWTDRTRVQRMPK